ncbi:MAG: ABC transporter permease [Chloroflexota bacterium]|nr:ABC transporter permease [Chloroflexota bacterium]
MPFFMLIVRNLLRQRIRSLLTALGISIGITTVVALGVVTHSVKATAAEILRAGGADFAIGQSGSSDLTFSTLTSEQLGEIEAYPGVEHAIGVLMVISPLGSNPYFVQLGIEPADLAHFEVPLLEGRALAAGATDEILLGREASRQLGKGVGDTVELRDRRFTVVGIYRTGNVWEDGGGMLPLATVQEYERKRGLMTLIYVRAKPGIDLAQLTARIEQDHPELATLRTLSDYSDVDQGMQLMDALNLAISFLAVFIGGIGVMNTMVMSVFERTREIGILRAVGWRQRRVLQMVLGESILLCVIGALIGSTLAVIFTRVILIFPVVRSFLALEYTPDVFIRGLAVGVAVALLGALYPAIRAVRLSPIQAIRYE